MEEVRLTSAEVEKSEVAVKFDHGKPRFDQIPADWLIELAEALARPENQDGLVRLDLIPVEPLIELAKLYGRGARKYADRNWEKGMDWSRVYRAMLSHSFKFWCRRDPDDIDSVDGQHHLDSVAWCALALREYVRTHPELDDRPKARVKKEGA